MEYLNTNEISSSQIENAVNILLTSIEESNKGRIKRYELKGNFNNVLTAVAEISEVFGGSCWSEDYHSEKETPYKEIKPVLKNQFNRVLKPFFENIGLSTNILESYVDQFLDKTKKYDNLGHYTDYEYYGNSTTYGIYGLNLDDLISETCSEDVQRIYHKKLTQFRQESVTNPNTKMKM